MRVLFLGGGTGGHIVPGIAVAEVLRERGHEPLFAIAGRGVEHTLLDARQLASVPLFRGGGGRPSPLRVDVWAAATNRWRSVVRRFDPEAIVVLGGWVALPAVLTGFFGRPSILLEQNARPGKVQRLLGRRVEHACLAVEGDDMPRGRRSTQVTGNPVPAFAAVARDEAARRLRLDPARRTCLLMGGSQGAADVNALLPDVLGVLAAEGGAWQVLHISGGRTEPVVPDPAVDVPVVDVPVVEHAFVTDMASAYALADVAVCRAGGVTVSELAGTGTPAVLLPYPYHADRHQEANGRRLVDAGGALMVGRDDPDGRRTAAALLAALVARCEQAAVAVATLARPDAARDVATLVVEAATGATP